MPLLIRGYKSKLAASKAAEFIDRVGLADRMEHKPGETVRR